MLVSGGVTLCRNFVWLSANEEFFTGRSDMDSKSQEKCVFFVDHWIHVYICICTASLFTSKCIALFQTFIYNCKFTFSESK